VPERGEHFQLVGNPHRVTKVKYRAPNTIIGRKKPLDWAMDRNCPTGEGVRDRDFIETNAAGEQVRHVKSDRRARRRGLDNEENYLYKKLFTAVFGIVPSRIRPGLTRSVRARSGHFARFRRRHESPSRSRETAIASWSWVRTWPNPHPGRFSTGRSRHNTGVPC